MIKYACDTIGVNELCITRLDTLSNWKCHYQYDFISVVIKEEDKYIIVKDFTNYDIDIRYLYNEENKRYRELFNERIDKFLTELEEKLEA